MNVLLFILRCCWVFGTCAVVSVSCKARLTCAGVVLFRAAADGIFVAGEGEWWVAHVWDTKKQEWDKLQCMRSIFLHTKFMNVLQTVFKTLVSLCSLRDSIIGTISTGELVGLGLWLALHPSETRFASTNVCSVPTELPTESLWAQAPHHLGRKDNRQRGTGTGWLKYCIQEKTQLDPRTPKTCILSPSQTTIP